MSPALETPESPTFETQARQILTRVRNALNDVVAAVVGHHDVRAADLVRSLGVDNRLAWKFVKLLEDRDPLATIRYVPGKRGVSLFLRAAAKRHAPPPTVDQARRAFEDLESFVETQAGSRKLFDMMITGHAHGPCEDVGLEHRRAAYEHNGFIWGVQARAQIHTYLIQPSGDDQNLDAVIVRGFTDLRRIRPQVPWRISRFYTIDDAGDVRGDFHRQALDPAVAPDEVPLLRDFCSQPLPATERLLGPHGIVDYGLAGADVGNTLSVTCLTGEVIRRAEPCYRTERFGGLCAKAPVRTPSEVLVLDLFLHRRFFGEVSTNLRLASDLFSDTVAAQYTEADLLPITARVERMPASDVPPIVEMAGYPEMIRYCFDRVGWRPSDFGCYRVRLTYPPMPSALMIDCPLPIRA